MSTNRPNLSEEEIDDLLYFARTGDTEEFSNLWNELCSREKVELGDLLEVACDSESGNGVIHMAGGNGHLEFIKSTLTALSTPPQNPTMLRIINAQNKSGNTPLHWAAINGHLECVKILMEGGADPLVRNGVGHDAVFEAEINGKSEVVEWALREGGEGVEMTVGGGEEDGDVDVENGVDGEAVDLEGVKTALGDLGIGEGNDKGKEKA